MTERRIRRAFDSATEYDAAARVQARAAGHLGTLLETSYLGRTPPHRILEIGCGTGLLTREIARLFPSAQLVITDLSHNMLQRCKSNAYLSLEGRSAHYIAMDGEAPCMAGQFDLICSNFCVQWFTDRLGSFAKWAELLRPGGMIAISTLVEGSFAEWHAACLGAGCETSFNRWPPRGEVEQDFPDTGQNFWTYQHLSDKIESAHQFLNDIRRIGALIPPEPGRPMPSGTLRRIMKFFDRTSSSMTYHVGFGMHRKMGDMS